MKKLFLILSVALFALGTVNAFAQEAAASFSGRPPRLPKPNSPAIACTA